MTKYCCGAMKCTFTLHDRSRIAFEANKVPPFGLMDLASLVSKYTQTLCPVPALKYTGPVIDDHQLRSGLPFNDRI